VPAAERECLPLTEAFTAHLSGELELGLYPLLDGDRCHWLAAAFDGPVAVLDALAYLKAARLRARPGRADEGVCPCRGARARAAGTRRPGRAAVLGSILRINRDTRFSPDKRPYKDHLDFWFWHGERAQVASGLFLRLSPDEVWVGAGAHDLQRERLERYRAAVCDPAAGAELARIGRDLDDAGIGIAGRALRRPPSGFSPAPDAAPFLLHKALFSAVTEPAALATAPEFLDRVEQHWARLAPLHLWLVAHVQADQGRPRSRG
jgi:uncharacterized protein (TIGR02453 family)